jgi:flagellin-specific chaperone FliS
MSKKKIKAKLKKTVKGKSKKKAMTKIYKDDQWNAWTKKSSRVKFKSSEKAVGDGEHKLGQEYGKKPLGQNSAYDLDILGEKWEIKKVDSDNSFRLGVEVATQYTPVIGNVIRILENVLSIKQDLLDTVSGKIVKDCVKKIETISPSCKTPLLDGLRKNEVAESNLQKANDIIEELKAILIKDKLKVKLHSSIDGKVYEYDILSAFKKLSVEKISIADKIKLLGNEEVYTQALITSRIMDDIEIFENISLQEKLNKIIRNIFNNVKLVLVHEDEGYKPISNLKNIYCNRITSGLPRCKML